MHIIMLENEGFWATKVTILQILLIKKMSTTSKISKFQTATNQQTVRQRKGKQKQKVCVDIKKHQSTDRHQTVIEHKSTGQTGNKTKGEFESC